MNRRRFIGPFERSNSQKQTSGCRSCIIPVRILVRITVELHNFLLHGTTMNTEKHRSTNLRTLSRKHRSICQCSPTNGSKHPVTDTGETTNTKRHQSGNASSAAGRLEDSGYEVVPDVSETDGDTWESINKAQVETVSPSLTSH